MPVKKFIFIFSSILLIYALLGFFVIPLAVRYFAIKKAPEKIGRTLHIKKISLNPFTFQAGIEEFMINDTDGAPLISFSRFEANFQLVSLFQKSFRFKTITLDSPYTKIILAPGGGINLTDLIPPPKADAAPKPEQAKPEKPPKSIVVESFALNNGSVDFTDRSQKNVFHHVFEPINLKAENISTQPDAEGSAGVTFAVGDSGTITIVNNMSLNPLQGSANLTLTSIPLKLIQPYIANVSAAEIKTGNLNMTGQISYHPQDPGHLLAFTGDVSIDTFQLKEQSIDENLIAWKTLSLKTMDFQLPSNALTIQSIDWIKPEINLKLENDKQLNLIRIFKPDAGETEPAEDTNHTPQAFSFRLEQFTLKNGTVTLTDQSITPASQTVLSEMQTAAAPVSLAPDVATHIEASTRVNQTGKITSTADLRPFASPPEMNLSLNLENFDMKTLKPYFDKYVGYTINNGTFNLTINYAIENGQLKAGHDVIIDTMVLGKKTDSPESTNLPVKLALYLIEDLNQQIKLDFSVNGNIADPSFRMSGLVLKAVINILTKAVASPFNLLGGMFGGSAGDLSYAGFAPNQAELSVEEHSKILSLAKILDAKPRFNLIIQGTADPRYDILSGKEIRELERTASEDSTYKSGMKDRIFKVYDTVTGVKNMWPLSKITDLKTQKDPEPVYLPAEEINIPALTLLAQQRARVIASVLIQEGGIDPQRISMEEPSIAENFSDSAIKTNLSLSVD